MRAMNQNMRWRELLGILRPLFVPFRLPLGVGGVLVLGNTLIDLTLPWLAGQIVDGVSGGGNSVGFLYRFAAWFFGLILLKAVLETLQAYVIQSTGYRVVDSLRTGLFVRLQRVAISYHDRNATGRVLTRVINDVKTISEMFSASMSVLGLDVMVVLGTVVAMLLLDWRLGLAVLTTFPFVVFVIFYFGSRLAVAYRDVRTRLSAINAFLGENTGALSTIQRLGAGTARGKDFQALVDNHLDAQMESLRVYSLVQPWTNVINGAAMGVLLGLGGYWVIEGRIALGILVTFLGYTRNLFQPIRDIVEKYNSVLSAMVSAERVGQALREPEEDPRPRLKQFPHRPYGIEFKDIGFRYETREEPALEHINLSIKPGERLAVVGKTGSGKSSLARLLLRFYEPQSGEIRIGGISLADWGLGELRTKVVMVPQEVYLFPGTVRENLRLGRSDLSDHQLEETCRRMFLWDFIAGRGGLDMEIQEGGAGLSMGQKQLLSFARVLTLNPDVVILDEATASLDGVSENRVLLGLEKLMEGRTSILIAHRLSTLEKCDTIIVLDQGRIVQSGGYQELKKQPGPFKDFYELYSAQA